MKQPTLEPLPQRDIAPPPPLNRSDWADILRYGFRIVIVMASLLLAIAYSWRIMPDDWQLKYSMEFGVNRSDVQIDRQPHDCEWGTAPIGNKYCHYQANVATINAAGETIGGVVDGKEFNLTPTHGSHVKSVQVTWSKVRE